MYRKYIDIYYSNINKLSMKELKDQFFKGKQFTKDLNILTSLYTRGGNSEGYYFRHNGKNMITIEDASYKSDKGENIGLNLCGNKGTGKTYLAACIANAVIDKGYSVYFRTMDQLVGQVFKSFDKNTEVSEICSYDLLIIDEFGTEAETSTVQQYVYDIINTRVVQKKPFIITTNVITPEKERILERI